MQVEVMEPCQYYNINLHPRALYMSRSLSIRLCPEFILQNQYSVCSIYFSKSIFSKDKVYILDTNNIVLQHCGRI